MNVFEGKYEVEGQLSLFDESTNLLERSMARIKRGIQVALENPEQNKDAIEELEYILGVLEEVIK